MNVTRRGTRPAVFWSPDSFWLLLLNRCISTAAPPFCRAVLLMLRPRLLFQKQEGHVFFSILFYPPLTNNGMNVSNCTRFISRCTLIVARLRAQALVSAPQCAVGSLKIKCVVFGAFQEETVASSG